MKKSLEKNNLKKAVNSQKNTHFKFLATGLACHALCLIKYVGLVDILQNSPSGFHESKLKAYNNAHLIKAALVTLVAAKVLKVKDKVYELTKLGKDLATNVGAFMLPFVGYRNLLAKQFQLVNTPDNWKDSDIDYQSIALASIGFGLNDLDPLIVNLFVSLKPSGTICDLGCGTGEKLAKICSATKLPGLGIDKDPGVVNSSKEFVEVSSVEIIQGDIFNLKGIWEDVETVLISFVYHDLETDAKCVIFLKSLKQHFPRLKFLVIIDIVSLSENMPYIMPGFDYVHGLQGISPRNYDETLSTFASGNYKVVKEIAVPNMPNTFIWVTTPH